MSRIGYYELGDRGGHLGGTMKATPWARLCPGFIGQSFLASWLHRGLVCE